MPTTYAHYRLGEAVRKRVPKSVQNIINEAPELFHLGVHGPDCLFYYNPLMKTKAGEIGTAKHLETGKMVFGNAALILQDSEEKIKHHSYVYGYLCHFAMDYICHGYIGQQMEKTGLSHYEIEAEYDRRLLVTDGYENPVKVCVTRHIHPSMENASIIADFYDGVTKKQMFQASRRMVFFLNLLRAPSAFGRKLLFGAMKLVGMYEKMHGLVMNYQENEQCMETTNELVERFSKAVTVAVELITEYETYLQQGGVLSDTFCYNFESKRMESI